MKRDLRVPPEVDMKRCVAVLALMGMFQWLHASDIRGTVMEAGTKRPVAGADIRLEDQGKSATSREDGRFLMEGVNPGAVRLVVTAEGYRESIVRLTVPESGITFTVQLEPAVVAEKITVTATRALERITPVVFTDVDSEAIRELYTVEDVPMMLSGLPNVYSYSDDGSGMGYSYLKVRGFDQSRVGVMINGVPLNDPEDHQVYWVDMPDFAESLDSIQLQRGVGSSLYGVDTFGGSINLITKTGSGERYEVYGYGGSFNTWKTGITGETPLTDDDRYHLSFRLSRLTSDGYRENSGVDLWAAYLALARYGERSVTRFVFYTGNEKTHAAWEASPESILRENHRHNPITYDNTIDDFTQPHAELHHIIQFSDQLSWKNTLFFIHGRGYYEQYKDGRDLWEYGLWADPATAPESDIIRQKWVKKNQYGLVSELSFKHATGELTAGGYFSSYNSHHWGEVDDLLTTEDIPLFTPGFVYHRYYSDKKYATLFLNELYRASDRLTVMANLHYQHMSYGLDQQAVGNFAGENLHSLRVVYNFWNPRLGVNVNLTDTLNAFANVSVSHREPADSELFDTWLGPDNLGVPPLFETGEPVMENGELVRTMWFDPRVKPEKLVDYEVGIVHATETMLLKANLFYMDFENEIVPYGQVNDDGFPIRGNAEQTVHRGVELSGLFRLPADLEMDLNLSLNDNYYKAFHYREYDWETGETVILDLSGNTIAGFPDIIGNATFTWRPDPFRASIRWQYFGKQYLDNTETEDRTISGYSMVHCWLGWDLPVRGRLSGLELTLKLNNVLNKKTYTAGYYDAWAGESYLWPSAGFQATFGVRATF